jgi:CPA2 family monovalent cation:H+ antiporter-2
MLVLGRRAVPWLLHYVAHTGSRELFRLAVLSIALGIAFGAAALFGVSFALGAFFAGMILSESELSHQAAQETLPLRDAFAVLFFVSVGMLVDPSILVEQPWPLLATLAIIVFGKSVAAFLIVRAFRHPKATAAVISASLAQIGEFSFILAGLGVALGILPGQAQDLILAGAIISILLNPVSFAVLDRFQPKRKETKEETASEGAQASRHEIASTSLAGHYILVGHGRVGKVIGEALVSAGAPVLVIEDRHAAVANAAAAEIMIGNAADADVLRAANPAGAHAMFIAIPDAFEAGTIVERARAANPSLSIIARAHSEAEREHLATLGASHAILAERELALAMVREAGLSTARGDGPAKVP